MALGRQKIQLEIVGDSRSIERAFRRTNNAARGFGATMSRIGKIAAVGFGAAVVGIGLLLRKGFAEFMEGQKVAVQTAAVLKSTGGVANVTARHVDRMAGALSRMSGVDDELVGASENLLLTFVNIRNSLGGGPKVFDAATKAILDMSVAMGKDLNSTTIMVGKALNDTTLNAKGTITGWSALRRVGVLISPMMMKQAAAFIRAGQPMKAQLLLIKELQTEFGGSAQAFGTTLPGAFAKLRNATDEVTGAFAEGLAPVVQRVATLLANKMANPEFVARVRELGRIVGEKLLNAFVGISAWFKTHWPEITAGFHNFVKLMIQGERLGRQLRSVMLTITAPLRAQLRILMAIWDKLLGMVSAGAGILSHIGIFGIGDKFKGVQESVDAARETMRHPLRTQGKTKPKPKLPVYGGPHARGGPVMPGVSYLVGERGPEMFTPGKSGYITPNGGGGGGGGDLILMIDKHVLGRVSLDAIQRYGKNHTGQTRGRHGGQKLALG